MSVSNGNLDALVNQAFTVADQGGVAVLSDVTVGMLPNASLVSLTAQTTGVPGPGLSLGLGETLKIVAVNDKTNTFTEVVYLNNIPNSQVTRYVIGYNANALLYSSTDPSEIALVLAANSDPSSLLGVLSPAPIAAQTILTFTAAGSAAIFPACYCPGTLIRTSSGDVPIETLAIGDHVVTVAGEIKPIRWIGRRSYAGRFLQGRPALLPVRISAGALAQGVPYLDLIVSPAHALLLDGVLVPAALLVNNTTIRREHADRVEYLHLELDCHDAVWANGAAAETFIDDDSRATFHNAADFEARYPDATPAIPVYCAPRITEGAQLERIRARLATRRAA